MPEDELPLAAGFVNHGRTIARLLRAEGTPEFLAGVLVEGYGHRALAADEANELVAVEQGMSGETPDWCGDIEFLFEIARPKDGAFGGVEAEKVSFGAERIGFAAADEWRGARAGGVTHGV